MALLSTQTSTSGGSSDTEQNALAVIPRTSSPRRDVTTVTPLAQLDSVPRNRSGSTGTGPLLDTRWIGSRVQPGGSRGVYQTPRSTATTYNCPMNQVDAITLQVVAATLAGIVR